MKELYTAVSRHSSIAEKFWLGRGIAGGGEGIDHLLALLGRSQDTRSAALAPAASGKRVSEKSSSLLGNKGNQGKTWMIQFLFIIRGRRRDTCGSPGT